MRKPPKPPKRRSVEAASLRGRQFAHKVIPNKKRQEKDQRVDPEED
jgi:hypothetical protein